MKLCRFQAEDGEVRIGMVSEDQAVLDLGAAGVSSLAVVLEAPDPAGRLRELASVSLPRRAWGTVRLFPPVERQEVWAAGVTYLRSKAARMDESDFSATAYDRVYAADRPELFFKALAEKVVAPADPIGVRPDSRWTVPEPELALVLNSRGEVVGYTIGNDVSARDIEGENLLYLPQAKIFEGSCALGPWIAIGASEAEARGWTIRLRIERGGQTVFSGETEVGRIKRRFTELAEWLFRCQRFPQGAVLLTGTGIVPPDDFSLQPGDRVAIAIDGIGCLENPVLSLRQG